jgi:hypothetical protein
MCKLCRRRTAHAHWIIAALCSTAILAANVAMVKNGCDGRSTGTSAVPQKADGFGAAPKSAEVGSGCHLLSSTIAEQRGLSLSSLFVLQLLLGGGRALEFVEIFGMSTAEAEGWLGDAGYAPDSSTSRYRLTVNPAQRLIFQIMNAADIRWEGNGMTSRLGEILCALLGVLFAAIAAPAQTPATPPGALAPEAIQPWGLPPPPPGVGPVELFADIHDTPQGKFLEGGAFDTDGNFWFVAIDTGWVSYLTPAKQLVPVFNCDPPPEFGFKCEPQGTRWHDGKLYLTTRHIGIIVYDPQTKKFSPLVSAYRNQLFKGPNDLDFDADGNLYFIFHRSMGHRRRA